ncbi:CBS domain-containing protein [Natranaeroarchaeum aerophilus]|uniref:CBS domain-containing protein n=1 Tax=Natranaeroarchaeum aerophilus TaxID=2917711 RepID=A0AAE3FNS8_9EURY|nr:CBS domain-containing protein [Natranaeroarchaeum aerophilus]MCL9812118.1 CBS domain-containing protein [Natranaeroarchaeum aerophilus]
MNVSDAMTPRSELVTVSIPGSRDDALEYLQDREFSSVPVVKETDAGEQYRGLVSRESLIEQPDEDQLALLMDEVPTVERDASVEELAELMATENARRIPVVDGELEGIITITDVIRAIATGDVDAETSVEELATTDINTTYEAAPLLVGMRELFYANVPYAVVLDEEGDPAGMLTEVDILDVARVVEEEERTGNSFADQDNDWMWEGIKGVGSRSMTVRNVELPDETVGDLMTSDLVTVSKRKTAKETAQQMITHDIEQIPLVSGDELIGVVRDMDLLEALYE